MFWIVDNSQILSTRRRVDNQCPGVQTCCSIVQAVWTPELLFCDTPTVTNPEKQDPLGEALHFLRMSGVSYCRCDFTAPWGLLLPLAESCARFHLVVSGTAILREGEMTQRLETGDLVLVPHGHGHALLDNLASSVAQLEELECEHQNERYALRRQGGGGAVTQLVCVNVRFDHPAAHQLIAQLPKIIHVKATNSREMEWLDATLRFIGSEARDLRPGGDTVLPRLADILIIQTIRWWIENQPALQPGWLAALRDARIGRAITLIHREPASPWTVGALAAEVAMSRSSFADRFTQVLGEPVMHYVARWRMYTALTILRQENADIGELATRLGYTSEAAFNRTFKRVMGITPGAARGSR
jgi:AraC-like DNA-binding protein/mannose-6-phosphate isomerase-like protein (cupin superfamily)